VPELTEQPSDELPCKDKLSFDTKKEARAAATVAFYQHGTELKVYVCKHCGLYHLASV
jgi:hypothetical protein